MSFSTTTIRRATTGCAALFLLSAEIVSGQLPLPIYTDNLLNGFQDWGWAAHNYANASPVHSGNYSVSVNINSSTYEGLQIVHSAFDSTPYSSVSFWLNGGVSGGQQLQLSGLAQIGSTQNVWQSSYALAALPANTWQQFTVPLSALGIADKGNATGIVFQDRIGAAQPTFYVDDIQLDAKAGPTLVHVSVNATQTVRTVDARHFGVNLAMWDGYHDPPNHTTTISLLKEMGCQTVRLPGGSLSDEYHWSSNTSGTNTWQWQTSFPEFIRVATNANAQPLVTVNFGSGTPQEAAAWVAYANGNAALYNTPSDISLGTDSGGRNWLTVGYWARLRTLTAASNPDDQFDFLAIGRSAPLGIKCWEIGNECYGTWETDTNASAHHAYTYATRATNYIAQMKMVDPAIKIGVVAAPGESAYENGYTDHPAYNPRTGQNNYGWTPVLLATLRSFGVTPDFLIHHVYPQWTDPNNVPQSPDNDVNLLASTYDWANDATTMRQHITDYFGTGGTNIELLVTENNSDAGAQGKQSTSLVNGLYYADSLGQLLKTEFNSFIWWDLRNGRDTGGFFSPSLYGWRTNGDLGMIGDLNTRYPAFYAAKLMQYFARPGDKILNATSDAGSIAPYACRLASGAVSVLLLNKYVGTNFNAEVALNGFVPGTTATVRFFGIPNDEAARTNGPAASMDITTNTFANLGVTFTNNCPPYSLTLLTLSPAPPRLASISPAPPGQVIFQLQGQTDVSYVIQSSSNLSVWNSIATNTLASGMLNVTNLIAPGSPQNYWRAVWQP